MRYEIQVREYGRAFMTVGKQTNRMMGEQHVRILTTVVSQNVKEVRLFDNNNYDDPSVLVFMRDENTTEFKRKF